MVWAMIENFRNLFPELSAITDAVVNSSLVQAGHIESDPVRKLYAAAHIAVGEGLYPVLSSTQGPVAASLSGRATLRQRNSGPPPTTGGNTYRLFEARRGRGLLRYDSPARNS